MERKIDLERNFSGVYSTLSWRAIFAGALITLLTYMALLCLGLAIGSSGIQSIVEEGGSARGIGIGAAIWMAVSIFLSVFVGSFASARVGGAIPIRVGRVQGLVVASMLLVLLFSQVGSAIGLLGKGIGSGVSNLSGAATELSQSPEVRDLTEQALGNLNLKSPVDVVAKGIATRLVRGNVEGAKNYLASQTGLTPAQVDARIQVLKPQIEQILRTVGAKVAKTTSTAAWTAFFVILLGSLGGGLGGSVGAGLNLRRPISRLDHKASDGKIAA